MLHFALRRVAEHPLAGARRRQGRRARALKGQQPVRAVVHRPFGRRQVDDRQPRREASCTRSGAHTYLLDGDNVRHGLNKDLGFTDADRVENIRRVAEVAQADGRRRPDRARRVHLAVPRRARDWRASWSATASSSRSSSTRRSAIAEQRDPKGLYKKARRGELKNFTGIDSPYEAPETPEIHVHTEEHDVEASAAKIIEYLRAAGVLGNTHA